MIRWLTTGDASAVVDLAVAAGLFERTEADIVASLLEQYLSAPAGSDANHGCVVEVLDEHDEHHRDVVVGVAYFEPAPATDRTWFLTMLAIRPDQQGQGRGAGLMNHVDDRLRAQDQRLILVQTSSSEAYRAARAFYTACGYRQEARVPDYYGAGDDMILFHKPLQRT